MGVALEKEPPRPHSHEKWLITTDSYKCPERDRHDVVENTRTKDMGMTEKWLPRPLSRKMYFLKITKILGLITPLPFLQKQM